MTAGKARKPIHHITDAGEDVQVVPVDNFVHDYRIGVEFPVNLIASKTFSFTDSSNPWTPFIQAQRFNPYEYIDRLQSLVVKFAEDAPKKEADDNTKRALKFLKTGLRNEVLANRFLREGVIRPEFTEDEREAFYKGNAHLKKDYLKTDSVIDLVKDLASEID